MLSSGLLGLSGRSTGYVCSLLCCFSAALGFVCFAAVYHSAVPDALSVDSLSKLAIGR